MSIKRTALILILIFTLLLICGCNISMPSFNSSHENNSSSDNSGDNIGDESADAEHVCKNARESRIESSCIEHGSVSRYCSCGKLISTEELPLSDCTPVIIPSVPATCSKTGLGEGKVCSVCGDIIEAQSVIPCIPHTETVIPATEATGSTPAKSEGKICSVCGDITVRQQFIFTDEYSRPENYDGAYGYSSLAALEKGDSLTALYELMDIEADAFHSGGDDASENGVVAKIDYSKLGLSTEEALAVYSAYRVDRPLYYWISTTVSYTSTYINLISYPEYSDASTRASYNSAVYNKVKELVALVSSDSDYTLALAFHDILISGADYAYEADGVTPKNDAYAHNILGVMHLGEGVCESYSKAYQLLLNYCNVENIYVTGDAGGPHAWNLVRLDDGEWYWVDLTWDDSSDAMHGTSYRYFAVTDTQNTGWMDGEWMVEQSDFVSSHIPSAPINTGINFAYPLPERSRNEFDASEVILRDTFTLGGLTYAVSGYGKVQLINAGVLGELTIPSEVSYGGFDYKVTSVGVMKDSKKFGAGKIGSYITSVYIPATVSFIWDGAFDISTLSEIRVDDASMYFAASDGVLFTKSMHTLIEYPTAKVGESYTVPDGTLYLAKGAFTGENYVKLKLEALVLGKGLLSVGIINSGCGYDGGGAGVSAAEWLFMKQSLSGEASITLPEESNFFSDGIAIYSYDKTVLYLVLDTDITSFTVISELEKMNYTNPFVYCTKLKEFIIEGENPNFRIKDGALYNGDLSEMICDPN